MIELIEFVVFDCDGRTKVFEKWDLYFMVNILVTRTQVSDSGSMNHLAYLILRLLSAFVLSIFGLRLISCGKFCRYFANLMGSAYIAI